MNSYRYSTWPDINKNVINFAVMRIDILTIFPPMLEGPFSHSIIRRAGEKGLVDIRLHDIRDYTKDKHRRVDDYPFGGGAGMVMMVEPVDRLISSLRKERDYDEVIYMSPDGQLLDQPLANRISAMHNIIILCGHYKGVDERIREHLVTMEVSVGDYVLSGGELPAAILTDAVVRLIPGVLGDETSALSDSFQDRLISPPVYTRPSDYKGWKVPDILLSGHDRKIDEWRHEQALKRTRERRPGLLREQTG